MIQLTERQALLLTEGICPLCRINHVRYLRPEVWWCNGCDREFHLVEEARA